MYLTMERLSMFIGQTSMNIIDVMEKIDKNTSGSLFIEDKYDRLCGCVTDGDIRRWILKKGNLKASVCEVMNENPKYLFADESCRAKIFMEQEFIKTLPIIDSNHHIVDICILNRNEITKAEEACAEIENVPVVIMAGGKGTRLYPYTKILPKPLIPIGDTPIIERIIECFCQYNIMKYYITVNYKKGMIKSYFSDLNPSYDIEYVEESKPLGTGGSIKLIKEKFENPIFITNCDAIILADYAEIYKYHKSSGNLITVVSALKNIIVPYGVINSGKNGQIKSMEEKPRLSYFINTGMYIINPEVIELIPKDTMFHMTQLVEKVMDNGGKVGMYPVSEDSFLDMGEFDEMKRMEEKLNIVSK